MLVVVVELTVNAALHRVIVTIYDLNRCLFHQIRSGSVV
jgi:hypothetical protein